ncbi:unnamed protein product [Schistosoma turkestanicum]|nr:unnamed protein product [Schistosoma turkestanicum]
MDDLSKRFDFKLSGSGMRNYGAQSRYMLSVNRLPKHTDSPPTYHRSAISLGPKSGSTLWNSSTSSLGGNVSDRLNGLNDRFAKLDFNESTESSKKLCNGYHNDYCSVKSLQSIDQRDSSGININNSGKNSARHLNASLANPSPRAQQVSLPVNSCHSYHRGGLVGLNNLGNTCFMNSILQCLSNTAPLTEYCLEDRYLKDINKSSSMNGMLFQSYADLMKEIWDPDMTNSSTSPSRFKSQIQRFAPRFMGYSQQDSQEFLRYVLEGLHMEVNRVQKRPTPIKPNYEAEDCLPDNEKADLYWRRYLSMDNSEIVDLFVGQLMSTLECCDCSYQSTTFDPFWDLSLPIPKKPNVNILDCLSLFTSKEELDGNERPNNETSELKNKPENKNMCKRGCGFYGSVRFKDMCSKCYQEYIKCDSSTLEQAARVHSASIDLSDNRKSQLLDCCEHSSKDSTSPPSDDDPPTTSSHLSHALKRKADPSISEEETSKANPSTSRPILRINRCTWCHKRVGLTGFVCRCDGLFCSLHRYADQHECAYDYQANGRLELARANPEVRCPKIRKL